MAYLPLALIISMLHSLNFGKLRSLLSTLIYICSAPVFLIQLFPSCVFHNHSVHSFGDASVERKTIPTPTKPRGNSMSWGRSLARMHSHPLRRIPHDLRPTFITRPPIPRRIITSRARETASRLGNASKKKPKSNLAKNKEKSFTSTESSRVGHCNTHKRESLNLLIMFISSCVYSRADLFLFSCLYF